MILKSRKHLDSLISVQFWWNQQNLRKINFLNEFKKTIVPQIRTFWIFTTLQIYICVNFSLFNRTQERPESTFTYHILQNSTNQHDPLSSYWWSFFHISRCTLPEALFFLVPFSTLTGGVLWWWKEFSSWCGIFEATEIHIMSCLKDDTFQLNWNLPSSQDRVVKRFRSLAIKSFQFSDACTCFSYTMQTIHVRLTFLEQIDFRYAVGKDFNKRIIIEKRQINHELDQFSWPWNGLEMYLKRNTLNNEYKLILMNNKQNMILQFVLILFNIWATDRKFDILFSI